MTETAQDKHVKAERLREFDKDFIASFAKALEAVGEAKKEGDTYRAAEAYASAALASKRLGVETDTEQDIRIARDLAQAGVDQLDPDEASTAIPMLTLGKMKEAVADLDADKDLLEEAVADYGEALSAQSAHPHETQTWKAILPMIRARHATAVLKLSEGTDHEALDDTRSALADIEAVSPENANQSYAREVWLAQGYIHLAEAILMHDPDQAQTLMAQAKEIIDTNMASEAEHKLDLSLRDWERLAERIAA